MTEFPVIPLYFRESQEVKIDFRSDIVSYQYNSFFVSFFSLFLSGFREIDVGHGFGVGFSFGVNGKFYYFLVHKLQLLLVDILKKY